MPLEVNPLSIVKKGFAVLKKSVAARKKNIEERIARKEQISDSDEEWLDNGGNLIDETVVVDILHGASDYKHVVQNKLSDAQQTSVERLKSLRKEGGQSY